MAMADIVTQVKKSIGSPRLSAREVEFTLKAPGAKTVCIAGQFNDWNTTSTPMKKSKDGSWKIRLKLPSGTYEYKYFVDGSWVNEASGRETAPNPFGTCNCIITV
jgi:1,4-alpha-glucan branching enzyme